MKIAIGGIGGSGTRAVAELFFKNGYHIGYDLNVPYDNLLYTLFFKNRQSLLLTKHEFNYRLQLFYKILSQKDLLSDQELSYIKSLTRLPNILHSKEWLEERYEKIQVYPRRYLKTWVWKEPNTHVHIDRLLDLDHDLKFIYVYRNGLDMAYSSNQNQLKLWGSIFLDSLHLEITPRNSLSYWRAVHDRILRIQKQYPHRVYLLNLEHYCLDTSHMIKELIEFLNIDHLDYDGVFALPASTGRFKEYSIDLLKKEDIQYVLDIYGADSVFSKNLNNIL